MLIMLIFKNGRTAKYTHNNSGKNTLENENKLSRLDIFINIITIHLYFVYNSMIEYV